MMPIGLAVKRKPARFWRTGSLDSGEF